MASAFELSVDLGSLNFMQFASECRTPSVCAKLLAMSAQSIKQHVDMNGYAIIPACVSGETICALAQTLDDREHGVRNLLTNRDVRDSLPSIQPF
jgi:hypothetical protein